MEFAQQAVQYGTKAEALVERWKYPDWKQRTKFQKPKVIVIWGDSNTGKTHRAMTEDACRRIDGSPWPWNDYRGDKVVLYDEFNGSIPLSVLLKEIDGWKISVPVIYKGNMPFIPEVVYICSNQDPETWYGNGSGMPFELRRRCTEIWHYTGSITEHEDGSITDEKVVKTRVK